MGDPAGIGPEVILKALSEVPPGVDAVVIFGAREVMELQQQSLVKREVLERSVLGAQKPEIEIREVAPELTWSSPPAGQPDARGAIVQRRALDKAMEAAESKAIDAIVTAPWNKELFDAVGAPVVGHTEILAEYFGVDDVVMMLAGERLRVALVTTHIGIDEVADVLTAAKIETAIEVTASELRKRLGVCAARIAVCALNPHGGEGGHMGRQEIDFITPLIEGMKAQWRERELELDGPFPADTLFAKFRDRTPYDAVVCMYHDQGLIPLKLLHFGASANITLGLPVVRTSVDHGTAYDIAGQGIADAGSMKFAMKMAAKMVCHREEDECL